jgi:peptidoglycan/xylan/chitin deacetylase (PgdA/CDA1 family)
MTTVKSFLLRLGTHAGLIAPVLRARKDGPRILMYHGVSSESRFEGLRNASDLHLARQHFIDHLKLLRKLRRIIGVSELVEGLRNGDDMRNTVALTFDDGYENNYLQAAPLLSDHNMTASFFLATNHIGTGHWIWTDRLEHAFDTSRRTWLSWSGLDLPMHDHASRNDALRRIKQHMKRLPVVQRDAEVAAVCEALGVPEQEPCNDYRFMNWKQATALVNAGFEVGAHTMNHAILSRVSPEDAEAEIVGSRNAVVAGTGQCCPVFCYPNGKAQDYDAQAVDICKRHFQAAVTTEPGTPRADALYEMPRQSVRGDGNFLAMILLRAQ